jgi:hypothetical protein
LINCAVMRNRLPALRTEPSMRWVACNCSPILPTSTFLPLNSKADVRAPKRNQLPLAAAPSTHTVLVQDLLGLGEDAADVGAIARELGITTDGRAALVGFRGEGTAVPANVIALSASAFRADAQVVSTGERVYVLLPKIGAASSLTSWVRGMVGALRRELGLTLRAVIAAPLAGLAGAAAARAEVDRVFDSADRHPGAIGQVTSLDEAHTTVLLDEIVAHVAGRQLLVDPRVRELRDRDPMLADTLAAYLDGFGDIAAVAQRLHVHPNTVRYRVRRIEKLLSTIVSLMTGSSSPSGCARPNARLNRRADATSHRTGQKKCESASARAGLLDRERTRRELVEAFDGFVAVRVEPAKRPEVGQVTLRIQPGHESLSVRAVFGPLPGGLFGQQGTGVHVTHELREREEPRFGHRAIEFGPCGDGRVEVLDPSR